MKKRWLAFGAVAVLLGLAAVYLWGPSATPPTQKPILTLSPANFSEFEAAFDVASGGPRLVVLVSPT